MTRFEISILCVCCILHAGCSPTISDETQYLPSGSGQTPDLVRLERFEREVSDRHLPTWPDAYETLSVAGQHAAHQEKKVLVQMSGPGCPPCVRLSKYLDAQTGRLSKDYVLAKLDIRMPNAEKVTAMYGTSGIPWMAIVAPNGELLVTGKQNGLTIGFPSTERSRRIFRQMLAVTSKNLSESDIENMLQDIDLDWSKPHTAVNDEPADAAEPSNGSLGDGSQSSRAR